MIARLERVNRRAGADGEDEGEVSALGGSVPAFDVDARMAAAAPSGVCGVGFEGSGDMGSSTGTVVDGSWVEAGNLRELFLFLSLGAGGAAGARGASAISTSSMGTLASPLVEARTDLLAL